MSSLTSPAVDPVLDRAVTDLTVVNTLAETTIYSFTVPANTMSTNKMLRLSMIGEVLNNTGATKVGDIRIKFGGTTIYEDDTATYAASADRRPFSLVFWLVNQDATNDQVGGGILFLSEPSNSASIGIGSFDFNNVDLGNSSYRTTDAAIDTTADQILSVTWQHSAASASLEFKRRFAVLEIV